MSRIQIHSLELKGSIYTLTGVSNSWAHPPKIHSCLAWIEWEDGYKGKCKEGNFPLVSSIIFLLGLSLVPKTIWESVYRGRRRGGKTRCSCVLHNPKMKMLLEAVQFAGSPRSAVRLSKAVPRQGGRTAMFSSRKQTISGRLLIPAVSGTHWLIASSEKT